MRSCTTRSFSALFSKGKRGHDGCESTRKGSLRSGSTSCGELLGRGKERGQGSLRRLQFFLGEETPDKAPSVLFPLGLPRAYAVLMDRSWGLGKGLPGLHLMPADDLRRQRAQRQAALRRGRFVHVQAHHLVLGGTGELSGAEA